MFGVNPMMIMFAVKSTLDDIINGKYPEGVKLKEKTENKIHLTAAEMFTDADVQLNNLSVSLVYKNTEILFTNE